MLLVMEALVDRVLLEPERNYGLVMDAVVHACPSDTNGI